MHSNQFKPKSYLKLIKKYIFSEGEQFPLMKTAYNRSPQHDFITKYRIAKHRKQNIEIKKVLSKTILLRKSFMRNMQGTLIKVIDLSCVKIERKWYAIDATKRLRSMSSVYLFQARRIGSSATLENVKNAYVVSGCNKLYAKKWYGDWRRVGLWFQ